MSKGQHYPANVLEDTAWCNVCLRHTQHVISGRKLGHCKEHAASGMSRKQEAAGKKREKARMNPTLF